MDLVGRHRLAQRRRLRAIREVVGVVPLVRRRVHDRRRLRRQLGLEGERVGLQQQLAGLRADLELVARAVADRGNEDLPDSRPAEGAHHVQAPVPEVEVADDRHRARGRRPDRERRPVDAVQRPLVRAHLRPQLLMAALAEQVLVEVRQRRREAVGILRRPRAAVRIVDLELVGHGQRSARQRSLEQPARMHPLELDARRLHDDRLRRRVQRPHDDTALGGSVRAQHGVRVVVIAGDEPVELGGHELTSSCRRRAMPATGIGTQSGRLLSS